jgi:hypothetical protein
MQKAVDRSAEAAEEIHRKVANLPLKLLEQVDSLEGPVRDIREIQDRSIGAVYGAVHDINHEVMHLAKELLDGRPGRRRARPRKKALKTKKVVKTKKAARETDTA